MKSTIYKTYDQSGDEMLKSKIRDLTFQTLKNTINSIQTLTFLHNILNSEENRDLKMRLSLEQNLINLRNNYLHKTTETHTNLLTSLIDVRKKLAMDPDSGHIGSEIDGLMNMVRQNWDSRSVDPEQLRDNLTDILRIVDPDASAIPRVVSKQTYDARKKENLRRSSIGDQNYISVGNENFGTIKSQYNPNMSNLHSTNHQTPFNGSIGLGESSIMNHEPRITANLPGNLHVSPRISSTHINHNPGIGTTITTSVGNIITPLPHSPAKQKIGKPRYFRLDDNGNRVEIDGPLQTIGTPNRINNSGSIIRRSPLGTSSIPQVNIATNNSAFSTHHYSRSPRISHSGINMTPQRRPMGMSPLTPSRMITPNTPPPVIHKAYPPSSPLRIFPKTPRMTPGRVISQPSMERRVVFHSPTSGSNKVKVMSPGGRLIRIEGQNGFGGSEQKPMSEDIKIMVTDAKEDFSNPEIETFDCDDCKFYFFLIYF